MVSTVEDNLQVAPESSASWKLSGALTHINATEFMLLTGAVFFFAWQGYARRWIDEDAFITLRVARNALEGFGPVFNIGERVEAYTHPLWLALLCIGGYVFGRLEPFAVWAGLFFSVAGLALGTLAARVMQSKRGGVAWPLGAIVIAVLPPFWDFATSGLETGLAFFWLGSSALLLASISRIPIYAVPVWLGLGVLVRPDFLIHAAIFGAVAFSIDGRLQTPGHRLRWVAAMTGLPATYQVFRMGYFATIVANPALAKEAFVPHLSRGLTYFFDAVNPYYLHLPVVMIVLLVVRRPSNDLATLVLLSALANYFAFYIRFLSEMSTFWLTTCLTGLPVLLAFRGSMFFIVRRLGWTERGTTLPIALAAAGSTAASYVVLQALGQTVPRTLLAVDLGLFLMLHYWWRSRSSQESEQRGMRLQNRIVSTTLAGASVLHGMYIVAIGGDHMHARLLLPSLFGLFIPVMCVRLQLRNPVDRILLTGVLVWAVHSALQFRVPYMMNELFFDVRTYWIHQARKENPVLVEDFRLYSPLLFDSLETARVNHQPKIEELEAAGIMGFVAGPPVTIVDRWGLGDPIGSRLQLPRERAGLAGHEKFLTRPWIDSRFGNPGNQTPAAIEARQTLGCGQLAELLEAIRAPLTTGRFVRNIGVAIRTARMRIPREPSEARAEFCR